MKWMLLGLLNLLMINEVFSAQIKFKSNYCACKDGESILYSMSCEKFCAEKQTNGAEVLFAKLKISRNRNYRSVAKWCNASRASDLPNPRCALQATDENDNISMLDVTFTDNDSIKVAIDQLASDKIYKLELVEVSTNKKSDGILIIKY
jgi:hypothetical protein